MGMLQGDWGLETLALTHNNQHSEHHLQARANAVHSAIAALETHVVPALEEARLAFAELGIEVKITKIFDVAGYLCKDPSIEWRCFGPKRNSDGWQFEGVPVFCSSADGMAVKVGMGAYGFDTWPKLNLGVVAPEDCKAVLANAIQKARDRYLIELETLKKMGAFDR
jgi:hypothetical protein